MHVAATSERPATAAPAMRSFGRFQLRQLLGKSERSMVWLAHDPRIGQDMMLSLPRLQPADPVALDAWQREVDLGARLNHPQLAPPAEVAVQDHWPFVAVDRTYGVTLDEWIAAHPGASVAEQVGWICQALEGLAFAHDAGAAHGDLQFHSLLVSEQGHVRLMGLAVASGPAPAPGRNAPEAAARVMAVSATDLRAQRSRAERDVVAVGLLLYRLLCGQAPLDETDVGVVLGRMPPIGREIVRLPWSTPKPVPEALRAIVNRATAAQERQRYLNARTFLRALNGWLEAEGHDDGGPLVLLLDRLRTVGHLPAMPGVSRRVAHIVASETQRTDELAAQILQDMGLTLELLRQVNSALVQGSHASGGAVVITVRRAIAMIGLDGVRRAANALRAWPGPLSPGGAAQLQRLVDRVRLAAATAQVLRPPGYDAEVVFLVVMLQNLGRLLVCYHFPDEAEQIVQLMHTVAAPPGSEAGTPDQPGMNETAASLAVLGVDIDALGAAVAKHWSLGDEVQQMMRRLPKDRPVRSAEGDAEVLRTVASLANELVDAVHLGNPQRLASMLSGIAQRYARVLEVDVKGLKEALQTARQSLRDGRAVSGAPARPTDDANGAKAAEQAKDGEGVTSLTPALVTTVGAASFPT
jgi:eukaryotic-like serine/threonine-protein kinase